jgi:hypothetical protein
VKIEQDRQYFWAGYEIALSGKLPNTDNEFVWKGWTSGAVEREGFLRATKWQARRKRLREFFRVNFYWIKRGQFNRFRIHPTLIDVRS